MSITLLVNALAKPIQIGVYKDLDLLYSLTKGEKASKDLTPLLEMVLSRFTPTRLAYANGPGSYMGIKLSFISLKTISIIRDIPLFAISAFALNQGGPIRANKALCFVKKDGKIELECAKESEFFLPQKLDEKALSKDNLPFYFLPAV